ncbi:uncharacterized protein YjbI with pentapeptide repeats [Streptomyces sp. V3I8]|nr:pentapeptide repeat-containing protein [Streptomyces sp. V3I8]MDQ1041613.1 uncharacterized protein YjbI with pentapeptide repeats [Streptomyces sp. V3I8]
MTEQDPVGCRGIHVPGHSVCLVHLDPTERSAYLAGLAPGADIDHRGTTFTQPILTDLLHALTDPDTGRPRIGRTQFESATFEGDARFGSVTFEGDAEFELVRFEGVAGFGSATFKGVAGFDSVTFGGVAQFGSAMFEGVAGFWLVRFEGDAQFDSVTFEGDAWFKSATFEGDAGFESVAVKGDAWFGSATFQDDAWFKSATFGGDAWFDSATVRGVAQFKSAAFKGDAWFESATFQDDARFGSATFEGVAHFGWVTFEGDAEFGLVRFEDIAGFGSAAFKGDAEFGSAVFERADVVGPLVCVGDLVLSGAVFGGPVTVLAAAGRVVCRRTRWSATAELRLRYASVDFAGAVFEYPLTIAAEPVPLVRFDGSAVPEQAFASLPGAGIRLVSLRGVDAAHLVVSDVDLSGCLFTGTVHLDQLRIEGRCPFATTPERTHWRHGRPVRFTRRRTLAEEHHWRAAQPRAVSGWTGAGPDGTHAGPAQLAPVYRALRKALEDQKDEPGAADFYYGETEMRRHDREGTTLAERGLLHGYWLLSGYGLRASRALGWLAAAMLATVLLLMGFGLAQEDPRQQATGAVPPGGGRAVFTIDQADPVNPTGDRFTGDRFEKALNTTLNSVVFRSSGQDLTTAGTYIEMASRLTEPILLGLAVLAVRNRVKR